MGYVSGVLDTVFLLPISYSLSHIPEAFMIRDKSYRFSVRIVRMAQYLQSEHKEWTISKQILKSGTSICANVMEAKYGQSRADFLSKNSIALKEAVETEYWLRLLHETGYLTDRMYDSIYPECCELIRILTSIVNSTKN